jgi:hypothetical protein
MDSNIIENYNEIAEHYTEYIEQIVPFKTEEDKDACLRFLRNNNNLTLSNKCSNTEYINQLQDYSDYLIYFVSKQNNKDIVAFAFLKSKSKKKGKILDILLTCVIPNNNFATLIAHSVYNFAVKNQYQFLYVSPRTPELRKTFIKYGFESIHGIEGRDELLEKTIELKIPTIQKRATTQKIKRVSSTSNVNYIEDGDLAN